MFVARLFCFRIVCVFYAKLFTCFPIFPLTLFCPGEKSKKDQTSSFPRLFWPEIFPPIPFCGKLVCLALTSCHPGRRVFPAISEFLAAHGIDVEKVRRRCPAVLRYDVARPRIPFPQRSVRLFVLIPPNMKPLVLNLSRNFKDVREGLYLGGGLIFGRKIVIFLGGESRYPKFFSVLRAQIMWKYTKNQKNRIFCKIFTKILHWKLISSFSSLNLPRIW